MIIKEINQIKEERNNSKKIFEMLKDVKLPKGYVFIDDCIELRYIRYLGFINEKIADIYLENDSLNICFIDEEELNRLRSCFANSQTKFRLNVEPWGYY